MTVTDDFTLFPPTVEQIDRSADPASLIEVGCARSRGWIDWCVDQRNFDGLRSAKLQGETLRVVAMQRGLGKSAELAALELVRRAERGLGVAIRAGQAAGEIRKRGDDVRNPDPSMVGPRDVLGALHTSDITEIYAVTDGVSDEAFENALAAAIAEKNLSRANVIRKLASEPPKPKGGRPEDLRRTRRHDPNRMANEVVIQLEGVALVIDLIDMAALDADQIEGWVASLSDSLRSLNRFHRTLKETTRE